VSVSLPNGITLAIAAAYAASIPVTVATNAAECVITVTNAFSTGDFVEYTSGWSRANNRVFRVKSPTGTTAVLEGMDTSSTTLFPAGSGVGSVRKISSFTQISQVMDLASSGGDPQYQTYSFLEMDFDLQIPTTTSAQSLTLTIGDDPSLAGYQALKAVAATRAVTCLKATLPNGGVILYNMIAGFDETPAMSKGNLMSVKSGMALQGKPVRYAS
jgi:hypothetical protein